MPDSRFRTVYFVRRTQYSVLGPDTLPTPSSLPPMMLQLSRLALVLLISLLIVPATLAQDKKAKARRNLNPPEDGRPAKATPVEQIKVMKDFRVELLYSVPRSQGSWVNMCLDPQGRLLVSDQGDKGLFRVTPPPIGGD